MKDQKGMKPIPSYVMLNFIFWIKNKHPEIHTLSYHTEQELLKLIHEFKRDRPDEDSDPSQSWMESIDNANKGDPLYKEVWKHLQ